MIKVAQFNVLYHIKINETAIKYGYLQLIVAQLNSYEIPPPSIQGSLQNLFSSMFCAYADTDVSFF